MTELQPARGLAWCWIPISACSWSCIQSCRRSSARQACLWSYAATGPACLCCVMTGCASAFQCVTDLIPAIACTALLAFMPRVCQHRCNGTGPALRDLYCTLQVLSVRWYTGNADAWGILDECAWPARGVAAIHDVQLPFVGDGDAARRFAAKFCNLHGGVPSAQARALFSPGRQST